MKAAHKASYKNRESILQSRQCGCFSCQSIFDASEVTFHTEEDGTGTAICPECGMDAVIGDASVFPVTKEFLEKMNYTFF